jgi:hypothetical protein
MNSIIGGYKNIVTGSQGSIGVCGSIGFGGIIGTNGTGGPGSGAYQITDWKEELQKKYNNRFIIKTDYDAMTLAPTNLITDNNTNREYIFIPTNMSNIVNETDKFIQTLIVMIRDEKLTHIFNGSKD